MVLKVKAPSPKVAAKPEKTGGGSPPAAGAAGTAPLDQIARLLMMTPQRVTQLVTAGYIPRSARGVYPVVGAVQGYIRFLKDTERNSTKSAGENRVRDARAKEIEMRIAEKNRDLIPIEDAEGALDHCMAAVVAELSGFSSRVTRDKPLRRMIDKELNEARHRMATALGASAAALRTGGGILATAAEADA